MIREYKPGERICVVGKSGSGKTNLCLFLAQNSPVRPVVIFNTKWDDQYHRLGSKKDVTRTLPDRIRPDREWVIVEPDSETISDPDALDDMLAALGESKDITVLIDESYMFHKRGQAGPGLIGLLTRGRSRGITTICGTQRPAWVSRFVFSEATQGYFLRLNTEDDKKTVKGYTGIDPSMIPTEKYQSLWVDMDQGGEPEAFRLPKFKKPEGATLPRKKVFTFI
jgi:energy-coupling factor transporter ATP-binding protein EcfA2